MPMERLSNDVVNEIRRLGAKDVDAVTIARQVNLPRLEVAAILAHQKLKSAAPATRSAEPLGESAIKDLWTSSPTPARLPEPAPAAKATPLEEHEATGIYVGEDADFDAPVVWDPADAQQVQNPHLMVMGESGSGKTYATQCLVAELAQAGIPSIIFDYGQSFETDKLEKQFTKYCHPKDHLVGEEGLALNPLEILDQDSRGPNTVATRLADVFDSAFRLGDIQKKVFIDAVLLAYRKAGILPTDKTTWSNPAPSLPALSAAVEELAADRDYSSYRNAAGLAARLTTFFMLVAQSNTRWSWDELLQDDKQRVHVLQFRGLEGKTRRALVEVLLWHMFYHLKAQGQHALRVYCVLDEAHHLSFREGGPLDALLREARKFGLGLIFASQQPQDFSPVAYSNTASKLVFQTADPDLKVSKFLAAKSSNHNRPEEIHELIPSLTQGHAFFITKNRGHTVQVADFRKRATQWSA